MYPRLLSLCIAATALSTILGAADETIVFKSDVALVRVDAQVLDRSNRAITGLRPEDFLVYESGQQQQIRNFARENMPVDVLFLIDVSGSMQPHVQRLASAAHQALGVLGEGDRVGIMVFDRQSRIRLRLSPNPVSLAWQFDRIIQDESFNGGTDITRGLLDAASYIGREGRKDARRAIVILTDDQTERGREEAKVGQALTRADAVLMALIAPDAMMSGRYPRGGGGYPQGGGGYPQDPNYPGGNYPQRYPSQRRGGLGGGGLPGIILGGGGYPQGGGGWPGGGGGSRYPQGGNIPGIGRGGTSSAGTAEIARQSGGDSAMVDDSGALEDTLQRIRQRYALYFYLPHEARAGSERNIEVALTAAARQKYAGAEVRYRQRYLAPGAGGGSDVTDAEPVVVSQAPETPSSGQSQPNLPRRRRPAVDDSSGSRGPNSGGWPAVGTSSDPVTSPQPSHPSVPETQSDPKGGWRKASDTDTVLEPALPTEASAPTEATPPPKVETPAPAASSKQEPEQKGGWRKVKPGEQP